MNYIAINGGGTKTEAVLFTQQGKVLSFASGESSSAIANTPEVLKERITSVVQKLSGVSNEMIACVYAGISGAEQNVERHNTITGILNSLFPDVKKVAVSSDVMNSFRAVMPEGNGIVANVSTGSSVFCVQDDSVLQIGGWGYLFGDEGSTFDLGQRAICSALREIDGRGSKTMMRQLIEERLNGKLTQELHNIYQGGRIMIASFGEDLLTAARKNDKIACQQLQEAASNIANAISTAGSHVSSSLKIVALSGALWQNRIYYDAVDRELGRNYQLLDAKYPKMYGAAVQTLRSCGALAERAFRDAFCDSLKKAIMPDNK